MKKRILTSILIVAIIFSLSIPSVLAYNLLGYKWESSSITYSLASGISTANSNAYTNAASNWSSSTDVNLTKVTSRDSDFYCTITNQSDVDWDGINVSQGLDGYFLASTCYLNVYYTNDYSTNKRRCIAAHEMGHSLGLDEVGTSSRALMNGATSYRYDVYGIYTVQTDDKNGVNYIY